eukprot:gene3213-5198_t
MDRLLDLVARQGEPTAESGGADAERLAQMEGLLAAALNAAGTAPASAAPPAAPCGAECADCGAPYDGKFCPESGKRHPPAPVSVGGVCLACGQPNDGKFCPETGKRHAEATVSSSGEPMARDVVGNYMLWDDFCRRSAGNDEKLIDAL